MSSLKGAQGSGVKAFEGLQKTRRKVFGAVEHSEDVFDSFLVI